MDERIQAMTERMKRVARLWRPGKKRPGREDRDAEQTVVRVYWYCPGNSKRVKPVVLTSRNNGVRGGSRVGFRKVVSKL
jgi:hypothetical protein